MSETATIDVQGHIEDYGHPPLIIGREYYYFSEGNARLVSASEDNLQCVIESRTGERTEVAVEELEWKPERKRP